MLPWKYWFKRWNCAAEFVVCSAREDKRKSNEIGERVPTIVLRRSFVIRSNETSPGRLTDERSEVQSRWNFLAGFCFYFAQSRKVDCRISFDFRQEKSFWHWNELMKCWCRHKVEAIGEKERKRRARSVFSSTRGKHSKYEKTRRMFVFCWDAFEFDRSAKIVKSINDTRFNQWVVRRLSVCLFRQFEHV